MGILAVASEQVLGRSDQLPPHDILWAERDRICPIRSTSGHYPLILLDTGKVEFTFRGSIHLPDNPEHFTP